MSNLIRTEVLVIGGGLAGLSAALEARREGRKVLLVCKRKAGRSGNTIISGAHLSGVFPGTEDTTERFVQDTLRSGRGIGDPLLVQTLAEGASSAVSFLEGLGVRMVRNEAGLACRLIPGHGVPRTICTDFHDFPVHTPGLSLTLPMLEEVNRSGVDVIDSAMAVRLLRCGDGVCGGMFVGRNGARFRVVSGATVLACGGGGRLFAHNNNTSDITGDGLVLAYQAGARLRDLEFIQFYPAMGIAPVKIVLPGALFADGAVLRNRQGVKFLPKYVEGGEKRATRDEMSRAIHREVVSDRGVDGGVFLDLSDVPHQVALERYDGLWRLLARMGFDPRCDRMTVGLAVHFFMGGMVINPFGAATVPGLYGAGEVTGGIHGANRLGGNALMEAVVFGRIAGTSAARNAKPSLRDAWQIEEEGPNSGTEPDLGQIRCEVQELLWRHAGVERCRNGLEQGLSRLAELQERFAEGGGGDNPLLWHETRNTLTAARLIFTAALCRTESRGAHYRSDFPELDHDRWDGFLEMEKSPAGNDPLVKFVPTARH